MSDVIEGNVIFIGNDVSLFGDTLIHGPIKWKYNNYNSFFVVPNPIYYILVLFRVYIDGVRYRLARQFNSVHVGWLRSRKESATNTVHSMRTKVKSNQ